MDVDATLKTAARYWQVFRKELAKLEKGTHPGASVLSVHKDLMVSAQERLLALGLDLSDLQNPQVVPVPVARHPQTDAEVRAWEAEIAFRIDQLMLSWAATKAGSHVVYSAVGRDALTDALLPYLDEPATISRALLFDAVSEANLDILALACVIWLLEPTGPMEQKIGTLDAACLRRILHVVELFPIMKVARTARDMDEQDTVRNAAAMKLGAWSLANISLKGSAGGRLRQALGAQASDRIRYARLLEELPGATQIAWEEMQPGEPLRPTGDRRSNLIRRVAKTIERDAGEAAMHPGKVEADPQGRGELIGTEDGALAEFELQETLRQDLGRLSIWVERAGFSSLEQRVYELDMQTDHDTAVIAGELGLEPATVRQCRKRYRDKLRKVAGS